MCILEKYIIIYIIYWEISYCSLAFKKSELESVNDELHTTVHKTNLNELAFIDRNTMNAGTEFKNMIKKIYIVFDLMKISNEVKYLSHTRKKIRTDHVITFYFQLQEKGMKRNEIKISTNIEVVS